MAIDLVFERTPEGDLTIELYDAFNKVTDILIARKDEPIEPYEEAVYFLASIGLNQLISVQRSLQKLQDKYHEAKRGKDTKH